MHHFFRILRHRNFTKIISLFLLLTAFNFHANAQQYARIDTANIAIRKEKSKEYLLKSNLFQTEIGKAYKGSERSYILKNFKEGHKEFNDELLKGDYIFDSRFDNYLDSIFRIIQIGNPSIPTDLQVYLSRNISLNAASMGDNRFIVNLGTFYFLDNQHQLGALISHELAHLMLKHQLSSMERAFKLEKKDSREHLSSVKSSKWNRGEKAMEKFRSLLYENSSIRRSSEFEADSLGYLIFKNSQFDNREYINIYDMMALYDTIRPIGVNETMYRKLFDLPNQPFKEEWMKKEDFSQYDYSKYDSKFAEDSLKSHPEMTQRVDRLKSIFPELKDSIPFHAPDAGFAKLSRIAEFERMYSLDFDEDYGIGIYLCLLHLQDNEGQGDFYKQRMGAFFQKISTARKEYKLNRYLDRVSPKEQSDSYITFLNFMWNLSLPELVNIADFYTKKDS